MDAGYTVEGAAKCGETFLMVSNFNANNTIVHRAFYNEKSIKLFKLKPTAVGVWKIKYKP